MKRKVAESTRVNKDLKLLNARLNEAQSIGKIGNWEWVITSNEIFWSDQIYVIFGLKKRQFRPTYPRFLERIHPEDRAYVENAVQDSIANRKPYEISHRIITPDDEIRYVKERGIVRYNSKGKPIRMVGTVQDITESRELKNTNHIYEFIFQNSINCILITDLKGKVTYANKAAAKMWNFRSVAEMLKQRTHFKHYWDKNTSKRVLKLSEFADVSGGESEPFAGITKDNKRFYTDHKISPVLSENGSVTGYLGIFVDISEKYLGELEKKEEQKKLHLLLSNVDAIHYAVDVKNGKYMNGKVFYISPNSAEISGISAEAIRQNENLWTSLIHPEDYETVLSTTCKCVFEKVPLTRIYRLKNPDTGEYKWFEDKITPDINENGKVVSYFGSATDVSGRIMYEKKLAEAEKKIHALLANIDEVVFGYDIDDSYHLHVLPFYLSAKSNKLMGFDMDALNKTPDLWYSLIHPSDRDMIFRTNMEVIRKKKTVTRNYRLLHRDLGMYRWFEEKVTPYFSQDENIISIYGSARDVTEQMEKNDLLKKSETKFRTLFENALVGIFSSRIHDGKPQEANGTVIEMFGYSSKEEFLNEFIAYEHWADPAERTVIINRLKTQGVLSNERVKFKKKNNDFFWGNISAQINTNDNTIEGVVLDVTKYVNQETALLKSLKEKETLLKELHHRVKNNLQIINSLIQLKYQRMEDRNAKEKLQDIKERIMVIAAIHENLYLGHEISTVEFSRLLRKVLNNFIQLHREIPVEVIFSDQAFSTNIETAIPLGLLIYEILSNSFKHAFSRERHNILALKVTRIAADRVCIEIADNGKGYVSDEITKEKMGLKIINNLVRQLHGELINHTVPDQGTTIKITIPLK